MKPENPIQNELNQLGIHLPKGSKVPMDVPNAYFDDLENNIMAEIKMNTFLDKMPKNNPFELPTNYFDSFSKSLQTQIALEKMPKSMPFEVPVNYFDNLATEIQGKIAKQNKQVEIKPFHTSYTRVFAIAASMLLFISIGFGLMNQKEQVNVAQQLAKVSDSEIQAYIQSHQSEFSTDLTLEQVEYESNVDWQSLESDVIKTQLNDVSDEELAQYL